MSEQVHAMFSDIAPRYDLANDVLSLGIHRRWRRALLALAAAKPGESVLDCATGTGDVALAFARALGSESDVVGSDFNAEMLERARTKSARLGLNVTWDVADATRLPYAAKRFDVATIAFGIRNVDDPRACLAELGRVIKPDGRVVVLEFGQPHGLFGSAFSIYARRVIPVLGQALTGNRAAYEYLPRTQAAFPSGDDFLNLMKETFPQRRALPLTFGLAYLYLGRLNSTPRPNF